MLSLRVKRSADALYLMERDYPAQGISPYYTNLCRLTEQEAATLIRSRLVERWMDAEVEAVPGDPGEIVHYVETDGIPYVRIRLPANEIRPRDMDVEVPLSLDIRMRIQSNAVNRREFLRNTGVRDTTAAAPVRD